VLSLPAQASVKRNSLSAVHLVRALPRHVLAIDVAGIFEALAKCAQAFRYSKSFNRSYWRA